VRHRLRAKLSQWQLATGMAISAALPYLVYSIPAGEFRWTASAGLAAMIAVVSFWYVTLPASRITDFSFLAILAAIMLSRSLNLIYTSPIKGVSILGHLMLIRTAALAALEIRRVRDVRFGFIPSQREWIVGVQYFFYFLLVGLPLALWLGATHLSFTGFLFWKTLAIFFGALWVIALSEEFFFRGLLQQWLVDWTAKPQLALVAASLTYGAAHLSFGTFPNWRMAAVDAVLGCFCGMAYQKTAGVRASMVTHALVVTVWRTMFKF
jgi:membrane protease YdiL (CAAX protease family)